MHANIVAMVMHLELLLHPQLTSAAAIRKLKLLFLLWSAESSRSRRRRQIAVALECLCPSFFSWPFSEFNFRQPASKSQSCDIHHSSSSSFLRVCVCARWVCLCTHIYYLPCTSTYPGHLNISLELCAIALVDFARNI